MEPTTLRNLATGGALAGLLGFAAAVPASPFTPNPNPIPPRPVTGAPYGPYAHPGKEFSDELDRNVLPALDAQQVIMWDGIGGTKDSTFDYDGLEVPGSELDQVDAIANLGDALFDAVRDDRTAALFSTRSQPTVSSPPNVQGAGVDDGAPGRGCALGAPVCYETTTGAIGTWATKPQVDDMNDVVNLDGLEVWGPIETDDANRFSLFGDSASGTSVYAFAGGVASPWLSQATVAGAVLAFLGITDPADVNRVSPLIDIDALMVKDRNPGSDFGPGDEVLFSLWPTFDPVLGLIGDEVFHLAFSAAGGPVASYFVHGGHAWDSGWLGINVDALEAAAPEPSTVALLGLALAGLGWRRRARKG